MALRLSMSIPRDDYIAAMMLKRHGGLMTRRVGRGGVYMAVALNRINRDGVLDIVEGVTRG